jgi:hypothetical protein
MTSSRTNEAIASIRFRLRPPKMKPLRTVIGVLATAALLGAAPAFAEEAEEQLVPPGNSAVNQYTEPLPTSKGDKDFEGDDRKRRPARVIGARNAKRLEEQGPVGREVAEVTAETAPERSTVEVEGEQDAEGAIRNGGGNSGGDADGGDGYSAPADAPQTGSAADPRAAESSVVADDVSGSSGISEVLAQATGSSGQMGLLLPLLILGVLAWSIDFALRRRREEAH